MADDPEGLKQAQADLVSIERLSRMPEFQSYFLRRVREKLVIRTKRVLSVKTPADETTIEKRIIDAIEKDVLGLLVEDEGLCRKALENKTSS
jgi:hypothetical protein